MTTKLIHGMKYNLHHSRFGVATVKVSNITPEWVDCEIISGVLRGMMDEWHPGDMKTVRIAHGIWNPVE